MGNFENVTYLDFITLNTCNLFNKLNETQY